MASVWAGLSDDEISSFDLQRTFQRSISELGGTGLVEGGWAAGSAGDQLVNGHSSRVPHVGGAGGISRRRNNSTSVGVDGGSSLLKHPSSAMTKLITERTKVAVELSNNDGCDETIRGHGGFRRQPVIAFCSQRHDLDGLQRVMKSAVCKAACRVFALQAFNWLLRHVTQSVCLHDIFWNFVSSLTPDTAGEEEDADGKPRKVSSRDPAASDPPEKGVIICDHPLSDITVAGEAVTPLIAAFHAMLQTVSDVMMYLPPGSALQQMAVRCWCLRFRASDHVFLHRSHVFSNISKILSRSDEGWAPLTASFDLSTATDPTRVCHLKDITASADIKASSRQAMIASVSDLSTETFWESGDEDKNKNKTITISCAAGVRPHAVFVHIDNARDLTCKVASITISAGASVKDLVVVKQCELEPRYAGWVHTWTMRLAASQARVIQLDLKGPDNSLRIRQIRVLGSPIDAGGAVVVDESADQQSPLVMQHRNCEAETLKVFRLLTSQVFGRLVECEDGAAASIPSAEERKKEEDKVGRSQEDRGESIGAEGDANLREHMVSILFSRSKLTQLQKQVCTHIVQSIHRESIRVRAEWEEGLKEGRAQSNVGVVGVGGGGGSAKSKSSDTYCFELLSLVLALSGSSVGRLYLAQQHELLEDLLVLLHTSSPRVQRQVC